MSSIQADPNPNSVIPDPRPRRRDPMVTSAEFGDLFAQFAQQASLGAAGNGSMSLTISGPGTSGGRAAQRPIGAGADLAQHPPSLREAQRAGVPGDATRGSGVHSPGPREPGDSRRRAADAGAGAGHTGVKDEPGTGGGAAAAPAASGSSRPTRSDAAAQPAESSGVVAPGAPNAAGASAASSAAAAAKAQGIQAGSRAGPIGQPGASQGGLFGAAQAQDRGGARSAAARGTTQPTTPRQPAAFRAQLAQGLGAALRQGQGQVTLRLRPHTLGEVQVRLQVRGQTVDAQIRPSTVEAHRLLEQSVDALRQAFEARGLQPGRIEIHPPPEGKDAQAGGEQAANPDSPEGRFGSAGENQRSPEDSAGGHGAADAGGAALSDGEGEPLATPDGLGSPGIVYSVTDGAARIVRIDALA